MSDDYSRFELEALKDGFKALTREAPPNDVPIPFSEKACRRVGEIISQAATNTHENPDKQKPGPGSE
jgi:hypothetical protein